MRFFPVILALCEATVDHHRDDWNFYYYIGIIFAVLAVATILICIGVLLVKATRGSGNIQRPLLPVFPRVSSNSNSPIKF